MCPGTMRPSDAVIWYFRTTAGTAAAVEAAAAGAGGGPAGLGALVGAPGRCARGGAGGGGGGGGRGRRVAVVGVVLLGGGDRPGAQGREGDGCADRIQVVVRHGSSPPIEYGEGSDGVKEG